MTDETSFSLGAVQHAKTFLDIAKLTLGVLKQGKDLLPAGENKEKAEEGLAVAEKQLKIAEAEIAQKFGYPICHCAFPPEIMLQDPQEKSYKCKICSNTLWKNERTGKFIA